MVELAKKPKPTSKERRRRKQLEEARQSRVADRHHILFDKCLWDNNGHSELRRDLDMIVTMDRKIHDELHRKVPPIPPLGNSLTMCVTKYYRQLQNSAKREAMGGESNPVIGIALLKMALDMIVKRDKATMLEIRQIELMQDNLDAQVEFILRSNEILRRWQQDDQCAPLSMCAGGLPACLAATPVAIGGELRQSDPEDDLAVILGKGAFE